jgi:hypothetical protein
MMRTTQRLRLDYRSTYRERPREESLSNGMSAAHIRRLNFAHCTLMLVRAGIVEERERTSLFIIIVAFSAAQFPFRAANLNYIEPDGMTLLRSGATFAPPSLSLCFACRERSSFCIFLASLSCEGGGDSDVSGS